MYTITSEQIIGSYAIRYKTLIPLINKEYAGCKANTINLFIDVADIIKSITKLPIEGPNPYSITASLINLCAHYRNFFNQYYDTNTKIFLITSLIDQNSINKRFIPTYNKRIFGDNEKVNKIIQESLHLLSILIPYIEDIHLCITGYEFGVYVHDIITHEFEKDHKVYPGIVLTKDIYNYQMVSDDESMVKVLRPKKDGQDDVSYIVTFNNAVAMYCKDRKVNYSDIPTNISPALLSTIMAMTRVPERNLPSLHQIPATIKALSSCIESGIIMNDRTLNLDYLLDAVKNSGKLKIRDSFIIQQRFNAVDIESQYVAYSCNEIVKYCGIINLYDPNAVKEISIKYFKDYPLDLNVL